MADEHTLLEYLGTDFQLKCLWQLVSEPEFAEKTIPLLELGYFDDSTFKRFFSILDQYFQSEGRPPNLQNKSVSHAIKKFGGRDSTEQELLIAVGAQLNNWNNRVLNKDIPHDGDTIQKDTLNFIKQQEYRKLASYIQTQIKNGDNSDGFLYEVEEKIKKIADIGDEDDMGIEVMENVTRALQEEFRKVIPTGIDGIDTLMKGGLGGGEIGIILAPSGVGKSTILSYIANTAYNNGNNVLQIIFEDNEDDIRRKHFAKWTKIPLSEIDERREETHDKIIKWHKDNKNKHGRLIIKKFSQEDTTMPKVIQYIEKYRKKHGIKFNIVILDYIDVLESHKRSVDQNASELSIIKSFEGMANDYNIPCWTAIQTNRTGYNADIVDTSQMGGNIKRAQKTHFLMSIAKTSDQKIDGQANIAILKARMSQDGQVFRDCIFDNNTMEIALTDPIPTSNRTTLEGTIITPDVQEKFDAIHKAKSENEEPEEYKKPDDTIKNVEIVNDNQIIKDINNNIDIGNTSKDHINNLLANIREGQDVMSDKK